MFFCIDTKISKNIDNKSIYQNQGNYLFQINKMRNKEKNFIEFIDKTYRYKKKYRYILISKKISINHIETQHYLLQCIWYKKLIIISFSKSKSKTQNSLSSESKYCVKTNSFECPCLYNLA